MIHHLERAEYLKRSLKAIKEKRKAQTVDGDDNKQADALKKAIQDVVLIQKPNVSWGDVAGLDNAKKELRNAVFLPALFPGLFVGPVESPKGILLYGVCICVCVCVWL